MPELPLWSPEVWDKAGAVGLALFVVAFHIIAYMRGWFVPGRYHKEMVDALREENAELKKRSADDAEIINVQMKALAERNVGEQMAAHLLESLRDIASGRAAP